MNCSSVVCCHSSLLLPKSLRRNPDSDVQKMLCSKVTSARAKGIYYESCVMSVLLFGVEAWKIEKSQYGRLRGLHRQKVRQMLGVRKSQVRRYHVSQESLEKMLGLRPIQQYVAGRTLQYAGHASRM